MLAAFLTTIFFSVSTICANQSIRAVGVNRANLGRLGVAVVLLGLWAHLAGGGFGGAGLHLFLLSGLVGMGLGDLAGFATLPRLGSRLTVLLVQCLAAPIGGVAEWLWLGTRLTAAQVFWGAVILAGITVALLPTRRNPPRVRIAPLGFFFGVLAAAGQGLGAVISRKAYDVTAAASQTIDGLTAAYQRCLGGLAITAVWLLAAAALAERSPATSGPAGSARRWLWVLANGAAGPVIGVGCYQWALATTPSGIVLPIVATTPLVIIPLSYLIEGERPTRRSLAGGAVAVAGAIALTLAR